MKTLDSIIDDVFIKEGDIYSEPPKNDQPTARGGITLPALQRFYSAMELPRRATILDLKGLTHEEARAIVRWLLEQISQEMGLDAIPYQPLRLFMLDFGYNSGGALAIRWLQRVLGVTRTGNMDLLTRSLLSMPAEAKQWRYMHLACLYARLEMVDRWTDAPPNKKYEEGLENRIHTFSLLRVP